MKFGSAILLVALLFAAGRWEETPLGMSLAFASHSRNTERNTSIHAVVDDPREGFSEGRDGLCDVEEEFDVEPDLGQPWAEARVDPSSGRLRWNWLPRHGVFRAVERSVVLRC